MTRKAGSNGFVADDEGEMSLDLDLLSAEARLRLEKWPADEQQLFAELLRRAESDVQREVLQRALVAGHGLSELGPFADAIRGMSDDAVYDACTVADGRGRAAPSVVARLRAEADPIYAFELNGNSLSRPRAYAPPLAPTRMRLTFGPPEVTPPGRAGRPSFEAEASESRGQRLDPNELGNSVDAAPQPAAPAERRIAEDLLNEAVRPLGLSFQEQAVDGPKLKLEKALESAHAALARGIPVPVLLGGRVGEYRRYALLLQVSNAGKTRAFQLHDPFAQETVWVNEGDLFGRSELPLSDKSLKRITAIALPRMDKKPF